MKKAALIVMFVVCLVSANSSSAGDVWPVGSIIQSLLEEGAFQAEMGTEWVKMDGRPVSKSDEISSHLDGTTDARGNILLPDARGKFLRMIDDRSDVAERTEKGDPEENRILGSYQADEFESHTHTARMYIGAEPQGGRAQSIRAAGGGGYISTEYTSTGLLYYTGSAETRPKNIAVNVFIKVRKCQSAECK